MEIKRRCKSPKWLVIVNCMGQPFYYAYRTLIGAFIGYAYLYKKNYKWHTMNFELKQFETVAFWNADLEKAFAESEE